MVTGVPEARGPYWFDGTVRNAWGMLLNVIGPGELRKGDVSFTSSPKPWGVGYCGMACALQFGLIDIRKRNNAKQGANLVEHMVTSSFLKFFV
jgi:hypothetical protein